MEKEKKIDFTTLQCKYLIEENIWVFSNGMVYKPKSGGNKAHFTYGHINNRGYPTVKVHNKPKMIHQLVCKAFIPNPENKPYIDHIDTDRTNNEVSNLRWVTASENQNNPISKERNRVSNIGKHHRYPKSTCSFPQEQSCQAS